MSNVSGQDAVWTVGRLLQWTAEWFSTRRIEGGRLAAELLLARAMNCRKIELYTRYDQEPTDEQRNAFRDLVRQAGEHTPIAYLLGQREFFSLEFAVTPAVLVPRPETEALVQRMIQICRESPDRAWRILDLGTGSGCIAVTIARYAKNTQFVASDISAEALAVAAQNAERHGVADRIRFIEADGPAMPADVVPEEGFDALVTNPPYISERAWETLPPNVRDHEPRVALTAGGDGLAMYHRLAAEAPSILRPQGRLLAEIGHDQHAAVLDLFTGIGGWTYFGSHRDPSDPYDRVVEYVREA